MAAELDSMALHTHFNISSHTIQQLFIGYLLYARHCCRPKKWLIAVVKTGKFLFTPHLPSGRSLDGEQYTNLVTLDNAKLCKENKMGRDDLKGLLEVEQVSQNMPFKFLINNEKGSSSAKRPCKPSIFQAEETRRVILK